MSIYHQIDKESLEFFSSDNVAFVQDRLKQLFWNKYQKSILVHPQVIKDLMRSVYDKNFGHNYEMTDDVINAIFSAYSQEWDMTAKNHQLDKAKVNTWDPSLGIQQYSRGDIKL